MSELLSDLTSFLLHIPTYNFHDSQKKHYSMNNLGKYAQTAQYNITVRDAYVLNICLKQF